MIDRPLITVIALLLAATPLLAAEPVFVPQPGKIAKLDGQLALTPAARLVVADAKLIDLANVVAAEIRRATGLRLSIHAGPARASDIELVVDKALKGEAYSLAIADRAAVRGGTREALARGTTTLVQAISVVDGEISIRRMTISDHPQFAYRGAMLDVARKPYSIDTLKQCVDVCRFYKVRYLQLHMTDENAWTFPSSKYPKLGSQNFAWAGGHAADGLRC